MNFVSVEGVSYVRGLRWLYPSGLGAIVARVARPFIGAFTGVGVQELIPVRVVR